MPTSTREAKLDLDSTGRNASDNPAEPIFGSDTPRNEPALRVHQAQAPGALPNRADHIRAIALQLADGAAQAQNRAVELRLNPEELGRVRLSIISGDGGITVNITAERGETLDLMRRNISQLEAEFRGIGYSDIQFSFEGGGDTAADDSPGERDAPAVNDPATTIADAAPQAPKPSATPVTGQPGLDLRL